MRRTVLLLLVSTTTLAASGKEPVDIGSRLELFVDDFLIDRMAGARLELHSPEPAGTVLRFDRPWEGNTSVYATIVTDDGPYRMYYRASNHPESIRRAGLRPSEKFDADTHQVIAMAESRDGIVWTRPSLGLFEFQGSKENNIVWVDRPGEQQISDCMYVFKDANPACPPAERYKALGGSSYPLVALVSPDGIHWRELQGQKSLITEGLHGNSFDALNVAFWDAVRGHYVIVFRDADNGRRESSFDARTTGINYGNRSFKVATSPDFIHWSYPQWVDFGEAPVEHHYTNATTPYFRAPHIYLSFPKRFLPWRSYYDDPAYAPGASDGVFMSSRDGRHWDRRFVEAFVRPGRDERNWGHRSNMAAVGIVPTAADEISLYYCRNYTFPTAHVERLRLRVDGFVSVRAPYGGGEILTRPLVFKGSKLALNYSTSAAGSIQVEIQDARGHPLPGFTLAESPLVWGDKVDATVPWQTPNSKTDPEPLRRLAGMPVRLRFVMRDADLYSIQFR